MPIQRRLTTAVLISLCVAGCANDATTVHSDRVYTLVGTLGAARWTSDDVPGSTETRPGTTLPAFLVCEAADGGSLMKSAAVIDRATLTLYPNGSSRIELTAGTWWRNGAASGGSGGPTSQLGRWVEQSPGIIQLSGFTTVAFNGPLQLTETGSGMTTMTFACPGGSNPVTPQLVFNRVR